MKWLYVLFLLSIGLFLILVGLVVFHYSSEISEGIWKLQGRDVRYGGGTHFFTIKLISVTLTFVGSCFVIVSAICCGLYVRGVRIDNNKFIGDTKHRFEIQGIGRDTGSDIKRIYIAKDEEEAVLKAQKDGIIVEVGKIKRL